MRHERARLIVSCPDRPGIVAAIAQFLFERGANIVHSDQHTTDPAGGTFFLRVEFDLAALDSRLPELIERLAALQTEFAPVSERFAMTARFAHEALPKRLAVFVSKEDHCLLELLWQRQAGELGAEIALIVSNHRALEPLAASRNIPFHYVPVTPDTKAEAERRQLELLEGHADAVILARYMQILSPAFIENWHHRIINIHHSFLPAFVGAKPYAQAHERGVKLIGATAHYVTAELDAGPIIEQSVERVDHRSDAEDLKRRGRHIERVVLARAVGWHAEDRVLVYGNKTVVFA